jgi:hypothetical protein
MLYRLLRPDEDWQSGVLAKDPNFTISVVDHFTTGSSDVSRSRYISTCGSLNSLGSLRRQSMNPMEQIVHIWEDNLIIEKY